MQDVQKRGRPFASALLAPWIAIVRPLTGAMCLLSVPGRWLVAVALLHAASLAAMVVLLMMWNESLGFEATPGALQSPVLVQRSLAHLWHEWHGDGHFDAELIFLGVITLAGLLALLLATLILPRIHDSGTLPSSLQRALSIVTSAAGSLIGLCAFLGSIIVVAHHVRLSSGNINRAPFETMMLLGTPALVGLIILRVWRVAGIVGRDPATGARDRTAPRCEGCGYDLSHHAIDDRCPECAMLVADSLSPQRRPGCAWESHESKPVPFMAWLRTSIQVLMDPSAFYASLQMGNDPQRADRFASLHYRWLTATACVWVVLVWMLKTCAGLVFVSQLWFAPGMFLAVLLTIVCLGRTTPWLSVDESTSWQPVQLTAVAALWLCFGITRVDSSLNAILVLFLLAFVAVWTPLVCWFGHRLVGLIVFLYWTQARLVPEDTWAEKVIRYEAAFLWVFCAAWGVLVSSFLLLGPWITQLSGGRFFRYVFLLPAEPAVVVVVTLALGAAWLWRYSIALRRVRWSNA